MAIAQFVIAYLHTTYYCRDCWSRGQTEDNCETNSVVDRVNPGYLSARLRKSRY